MEHANLWKSTDKSHWLSGDLERDSVRFSENKMRVKCNLLNSEELRVCRRAFHWSVCLVRTLHRGKTGKGKSVDLSTLCSAKGPEWKFLDICPALRILARYEAKFTPPHSHRLPCTHPGRKYLNECTPFVYISLCTLLSVISGWQMGNYPGISIQSLSY